MPIRVRATMKLQQNLPYPGSLGPMGAQKSEMSVTRKCTTTAYIYEKENYSMSYKEMRIPCEGTYKLSTSSNMRLDLIPILPNIANCRLWYTKALSY